MQHIGIVETLMIVKPLLPFNVGIFYVNLQGLRKTRLLFGYRLGDEDPRIVFIQRQQQRRTLLHHGNELFIPHSGGIE